MWARREICLNSGRSGRQFGIVEEGTNPELSEVMMGVGGRRQLPEFAGCEMDAVVPGDEDVWVERFLGGGTVQWIRGFGN